MVKKISPTKIAVYMSRDAIYNISTSVHIAAIRLYRQSYKSAIPFLMANTTRLIRFLARSLVINFSL